MAVNASVIIGYQTEGFIGAVAVVAGCALPPLLVMILVSLFYNRFINIGIALMIAAFAVLRKLKTNPLYIMLGCGLINAVVCSLL